MHHKKKQPKTYIHYGNTSFDPTKTTNPRWDKPAGFWASPVCSEWGWKDFLETEDWRTETLNKSFQFRLKKGTRILKIHKVQDIYPYLKERKETLLDWKWQLDHDALKRNYDGMEVFISDCWGLFHDHPLFWSWDVDSLVIWNMDKVEMIK